MVDTGQTLIVRHREPRGQRIASADICLYTVTTSLHPYENLQSEIFEHLLAIMDEFGLRVFQQPAGHDLFTMKDRNSKSDTLNT